MLKKTNEKGILDFIESGKKAMQEKAQKRLDDFLAEHEGKAVKKHENDLFFTREIKLTVNQMVVDTSYQREPKERMGMHKKIVADGFNLNRAEPFHVCIRKDGTPVILDGAGRWYIMKHLLNMGNVQVRCLVHPFVKTIEEEAIVFLALNPDNQTKVNATQKYKVRVLLEDKAALAIEAACKKGGLSVLGSGRNRIPLAAAEVLNHIKKLTEVGILKNEAWPKFKIDSWMFIALGAVLTVCPKIKEKELIKTLINWPPERIYSEVYQKIGFGTPHSRNMPPLVTQIILKHYNLGRSKNAVDPDWSKMDDQCREFPYKDRWGWHMRGEKGPT